MDYYKVKYWFQWWWFSGGGKQNVTAAFGALGIFLIFAELWVLAYLLEP